MGGRSEGSMKYSYEVIVYLKYVHSFISKPFYYDHSRVDIDINASRNDKKCSGREVPARSWRAQISGRVAVIAELVPKPGRKSKALLRSRILVIPVSNTGAWKTIALYHRTRLVGKHIAVGADEM